MLSIILFALFVIVAGVLLTTWIEKQGKQDVPKETLPETSIQNECSCTSCTCKEQCQSAPEVSPQTIVAEVSSVTVPAIEPVPAVVPEPVQVVTPTPEKTEQEVSTEPVKKKRGRKPKKK